MAFSFPDRLFLAGPFSLFLFYGAGDEAYHSRGPSRVNDFPPA